MKNENFKQKKLIKNLLLFVLLFCSTVTVYSQSQLKKWHFNGEGVDFSTGVPVVYSMPVSLTGAESASNGFYSPGGDLFYVLDNKLYDKNGGLIDVFEPFNPLYDRMGPEIIVIPIPGICTKFYIVYLDIETYTTGTLLYLRSDLRYSEFDMTLNSGLGGITPGKKHLLVTSIGLDAIGSIAVSKLKPNGIRNLYFVASEAYGGKVIKCEVDLNGISNPQIIYQSFNNDFATCEVELSHDETMLAFGNLKKGGSGNTVDVTLLHLDANGNLNTSLGNNGVTTYDLPGSISQAFTGVEFSPDNTKLFVGAPGVGVYWIYLSGNGNFPLISNSLPLADSHLELAYNGWIYAATSTNQLRAIDPDPVLPVLATGLGAAINFTSNPIIANQHTTWTFNNPAIRVIPDQIDGEDYDYIFLADLECCRFYNAYDKTSFTATVSATWDPGFNPINNGSGAT
ncbi:MAG: hypothetical protein ACR2GN_07135, partial [Bacteroidia bacterium]